MLTRIWKEASIVVIDTETTGTAPGTDRAVQVGLCRFEGGAVVDEFVSLVNPGMPIPAEATAVHGIKDEDVVSASTIEEVFALPQVRRLIDGTVPCAYNQRFDREFVPFVADAWLDPLVIVREVDKYQKGKGRHTLSVTCARHGVELTGAHDALQDARATGHLFYRLAPMKFGPAVTMGEVLEWQRKRDAVQRAEFEAWLARQPKREGATA